MLSAGALFLTACGTGREDDTTSDPNSGGEHILTPVLIDADDPGEPQPGGILTMADNAETRSFDPAKVNSAGYAGGSVLVALYDQLWSWDDATKTFVPGLATAVEPNEDFTTWTVQLREGVQFSDGTPFNADAVVASVNYYVENNGADMGVIAPNWEGVTKVDDSTVTFNLKQTWPTFDHMLGRGMGMIVAPAAIENGPDNFTPIGAGAFVFDSYKPQEELIFTPNQNFWDGPPHLEELRIVWLGGDDVKVDAFKGGSVQVALVANPQQVTELREAETHGVLSLVNGGAVLLMRQADDLVGGYETARLALAHALDPQAITDRAYGGYGVASKSIYPELSQWYNPDATPPAHDPERARELLDEAKAEGFSGKVSLINLSDPASRDQSLAIQGQLEAVGFEVETEFPRSVADYINQVFVERQFDTTRTSMSSLEENPFQGLYNVLHSTAIQNAAGINDPQLDALLDAVRSAEPDAITEPLQELEQYIFDTAPIISLSGQSRYTIWQDNIHGVRPTNDSMLDFSKAWIGE